MLLALLLLEVSLSIGFSFAPDKSLVASSEPRRLKRVPNGPPSGDQRLISPITSPASLAELVVLVVFLLSGTTEPYPYSLLFTHEDP